MFELLHNGAKLGIIFHIMQVFVKNNQIFLKSYKNWFVELN